MFKMIFLIQLLFFVKIILSEQIENPVVCISDGCIRGTTRPGYQSGDFEAFMGIPFAEPPVGNLRFANPVPKKPWGDSIVNATTEVNYCAQKNYFAPGYAVSGSEDCLYLNVYRPKSGQQSIELLPVMVFIYGGGLFSGSAGPTFYGPEFFMDSSEVVFVTIAYRLGSLGFLTSGDGVISGNFGFKDQNLGLKWVQKNIKAFGGNPNSVTLFGQSAGSTSVHLQMLSPQSKNLFHRAILMSGTAIGPFVNPVEDPLLQTKTQAKYAGIENVDHLDTSQILDALRKVDVTTLLESERNMRTWNIDPLVTFRLAIESPNDPHAFMTKHPKELLEKGEYTKMPLMLSVTENEGAVRGASIVLNKDLLADLNKNLDDVLPIMLFFKKKSEAITKSKVDKLIHFYLNGTKTIDETNRNQFMKMLGDRYFYYPYYKTYSENVKHTDSKENPTNLIHFAFKGPYSYSMLLSGTSEDFGAIHCDDLFYLLRSPALFPDFDKNSLDAKLLHNMVKTYTNFAKTGEPIKWVPVHDCQASKNHGPAVCDYQDISKSKDGNDIKITAKNDENRMAAIQFWDDLDA